MLITILLFIASFAIIIFGANILTDGASTLAARLGVPSLIIGLTVVAFGTSAPELVVSLTSSIKGNADISLGNVVGSNIFNILAVLGIASMVYPIKVNRSLFKIDMPFMLFAFVLLFFMAFDNLWFHTGHNVISRVDGIILLSLFLLHLTYSILDAKKSKVSLSEEVSDKPKQNIWFMILKIVGGLVLLVYGGDLLVSTSTEIATNMGISESVIAVTLVAMGTSVPELATSIVAAYKRESDIAIGNVVGSCIFNILSIIGITSTFSGINVIGISLVDFSVMILSGFLLIAFSYFYGDRVINRVEGFVFVSLCVLYYIYVCV